MALLVVFLVSFSLATGALEVGRRGDGAWHLSAVDTRGQHRMRLLISSTRLPSLTFYNAEGDALSLAPGR